MEREVRPGAAHGVVAPVPVDPTGRRGPTRRQAAGPEWRRSSRGLYVPTYVERGPEQRIVEVGSRIPEAALVTGWAALRWRGATWFSGLDDQLGERPVAVTGPAHGMRAQDDLVWTSSRAGSAPRSMVDGLAVTEAVVAVAHDMRHATNLTAAVQALDMAAYADLVSVAEALAWLCAHPRRHGAAQARRACALADENTWSPMESVARGHWRRARPGATLLTNHPIFDLGGHHVVTPDLLDTAAGVVLEYEGGVHLTASARHDDVVREALYRRHALEVVVMTSPDLGRPTAFRQRLDAAYARASTRPATDRSWTHVAPAWWVPTDTVERRRALTPAQRRRWVRRGPADR